MGLGALGLLASIAVARPAGAQTPAAPGTADLPAPAATDAGAPPPAAPAPDPASNLTDLHNRIDAAEQTARIAMRRVELLEEQLAARAKEPKDNPWFAAGERGFAFRSSDGLYLLRVKGQLQVDTRWFLNDGALSDKADTFLIRRMRPSLDGTVLGLVDYKLTRAAPWPCSMPMPTSTPSRGCGCEPENSRRRWAWNGCRTTRICRSWSGR